MRLFIKYYFQTGKTAAIRRTAVRKTDVSRHHGGPMENPLEHHSNILLRGLRRDINCAPMMLRDAGLSDSYTSDRCYIFSAVLLPPFPASPHHLLNRIIRKLACRIRIFKYRLFLQAGETREVSREI